jgi:hypothetical protein
MRAAMRLVQSTSPRAPRLVWAAGVVGLVLLLTSCGGSSPSGHPSADKTPPTTSTTTTASTVPASINEPAALPCTKAIIDAAATTAEAGTVVTSFGCAGDFAYALVQVPQATGQGATNHASTDLFKDLAGSWHNVSRTTYCPAHQVPTAIYSAACDTA